MTSLLVFHGAVGYRHDSIGAGVEAVLDLAADHGVTAIESDDARIFGSRELADHDAVVWMQNSGTGLLDAGQRAAYEVYTHEGGGFAGVHAASDAERDWPLFGQLVGAPFKSHAHGVQPARVHIEVQDDPSTAHLPEVWEWCDEWYTFEQNPRPRVTVLATLVEASFDAGEHTMGDDHPIVWRTEVGEARAWYTALGHEAASFEDPQFRAHLWGGVSSVFRTRR